jgi:hypothetical protein
VGLSFSLTKFSGLPTATRGLLLGQFHDAKRQLEFPTVKLTIDIGNLNEMFRKILCSPFDFATLRSGRAVAVSVRAERNPQGEVEA